jgi:hypothetical protein
MARRGWLVLLLGATLVTACRRKAPAPLVNQDFQFQLAWPGEGWSLLDAREAHGVVPGAVAGALSKQGAQGAVVVESADPSDLEAVARQIAENVAVGDRKLSPFTPLRFAGVPAVRWGTTGTFNGMPVRFEHTVFAHQKHLYQVLVFASGGPGRGDADFRPFTDAFSLLPGEVRERVGPVKVADASGVGWRLRGGVYQNAAYGIRASPRPGWHITVGPELARMNASAEFGLGRSSPQAFIVALAERAPPDGERTDYRRGIVARTVQAVSGTVVPTTIEAVVGGVEVPLSEYATAGPLPLRYLHGVLFQGREAIQLIGWTPVSEGEAGLAAIIDGLGGIELLEAQERARLRQELEGKVDPRSLVGPDFSFRRDVYRDFGRGFAFHRSGLWRVTAGDQANQRDEGAVLWLDEPALGLLASVSVTPTEEDAATAHHQEVSSRLLAPSPPVAARLGGQLAMRSSGVVHSEAVKLQWEVVTVVHDRRLYAVNLWGLPPDVAAAQGEIDRMLAAFDFSGPDLERPGTREGNYRDLRLGFAYRPPAGAWQSKALTPAGVAADMHLVTWARSNHQIFVGALGVADQSPAAAVKGMEARLRSLIGDDARRSPGALGGQRCERSRSRKGIFRIETYVLERDGIAYMLIASAPILGHGSFFEDAAAGFAFLD